MTGDFRDYCGIIFQRPWSVTSNSIQVTRFSQKINSTVFHSHIPENALYPIKLQTNFSQSATVHIYCNIYNCYSCIVVILSLQLCFLKHFLEIGEQVLNKYRISLICFFLLNRDTSQYNGSWLKEVGFEEALSYQDIMELKHTT